MIVAIHQPHFLPWQGYFERMQKADLFILLDHVQFERQNYQNRVMIKTGEGARWVTVPVCQISRQETIIDKQIDNHGENWGRKIFLTLKYAYQGTPFFKIYAPALQDILEERCERLSDLNFKLLEFLRNALGITTPIVKSSDMHVPGLKNELVLGLCKAVDADTFLGGLGGSREYLDTEAFRQAGIRVMWQDFVHPRYKQHPRSDTFIPGLSAVDLLFNCGPESGDILQGKAMAYAANA